METTDTNNKTPTHKTFRSIAIVASAALLLAVAGPAEARSPHKGSRDARHRAVKRGKRAPAPRYRKPVRVVVKKKAPRRYRAKRWVVKKKRARRRYRRPVVVKKPCKRFRCQQKKHPRKGKKHACRSW